MSRNRSRAMPKKQNRVTRKERSMIPRVWQKRKESLIMCPFCVEPHPISAEPSYCGTVVKIEAVQPYYRNVKVDGKPAPCRKCGKSGGDMILFNGLYVHKEDCDPGHMVLGEVPEYSRSAALVAKLPSKIGLAIMKRSGLRPRMVYETDEDQNRTDKIAGYYWSKTHG